MKKIISLFLAILLVFSITGCGNKKDSLHVIDFENETLNIDTSKIEEYLKGKGCEDYLFDFDADKSIYSCEVYLSEEDSNKIEIDGNDYEDFISTARRFLTEGTRIMADVLNGYNLTGISSGMVLASSEGVVYCVAVDGSVTYIAHVKSDSVTAADLKKKIEEIANSVLNDKLTITINNSEKFVSIRYEGQYNGGSEQSYETVEEAFNKVKEYLKEIGFGNYVLDIHGYEGCPSIKDENDVKEEQPVVETPQNTSYSRVGKTLNSNFPVFEVISTAESAESDGALASKTLAKELNDETFFFMMVDENERFLGNGSKDKYTPYVYKEFYESSTEPPYVVPFNYYFFKYFDGIETDGYKTLDSREYGGRKKYEFSIQELDSKDKEACVKAAEKIVELMNLTLGNDIKIIITLYEGTKNEIIIETPAEMLEEN